MTGDSENDEDLRLLLAPGSSMGGARPKASVHDRDGSLALAKFPHRDDEIDLVRWEALALRLAEKAGITVPVFRLETVADRPVLLLRRFDRNGSHRIPFLSAMSMLGANEREPHSYLEIADAIRQQGGAPKKDLSELWRRMVFNVLISNTDDHLRNHGFLYAGLTGWRLAPAYDLNPVPTHVKPRVLATSIDGMDGKASLQLAFEVSAYFEVTAAEAKKIAVEVGRTVAQWRNEATGMGLSSKEINLMTSAFEHKDLELALGMA